MSKLGVNIDHVATLRQARRGFEPDPLKAAALCEKAGADSIVAHLREDRRHIQDSDIRSLRNIVKTRFNLEMAMSADIIETALRIQPDQATLVPERRQEITTEGGLDIIKYFQRVKQTVRRLEKQGIRVSLFIAPDKKQIFNSCKAGARMIELHTGPYANAKSVPGLKRELNRLKDATAFAKTLGLIVNAGHGLNYQNVRAVAQIPGIEELNIGHSIVSYAIFVGFKEAVRKMKELIH